MNGDSNGDESDVVRAYYARSYDAWVPDWPGELEFYLSLARSAGSDAQTLELAAGTGRIATRLAQAGIPVTALDVSRDMVAVGRAKSEGIEGIRWVEADMRSFELPARFGLVIIPGHSFQNLLTGDDQLACLQRIRRHLRPTGRLVIHLDHQDVDWLGELYGSGGSGFEPAETFHHPESGREVRASHAWRYERSTQTAVVTTRWEELDDDGAVARVIDSRPTRIHCVFPLEMEHLLGRAGFSVDGIYGDFHGGPLTEQAAEMVWIARRSPRS